MAFEVFKISKSSSSKVFKLGIENDLRIPRNDVVPGFKGHSHRVSKYSFHTNVWSITPKQMIPKLAMIPMK